MALDWLGHTDKMNCSAADAAMSRGVKMGRARRGSVQYFIVAES